MRRKLNAIKCLSGHFGSFSFTADDVFPVFIRFISETKSKTASLNHQHYSEFVNSQIPFPINKNRRRFYRAHTYAHNSLMPNWSEPRRAHTFFSGSLFVAVRLYRCCLNPIRIVMRLVFISFQTFFDRKDIVLKHLTFCVALTGIWCTKRMHFSRSESAMFAPNIQTTGHW